MITVSRFAVGLLFISSASAFFRLQCSKPVLNANVDPIVNPGMPSPHSHTLQGSGAISPDATFADLRKSNCSTCKVKDDQSVYWANSMFYQYPNGSFELVSHGGMLTYYLQRTGYEGEPLKAFPDGFRMLTGDPYARSYTGTQASQAISWLCLNYNAPYENQTPGFANTNCPDGLRAQIFFPSCWDGKNLDSPDHMSHMSYPDRIDSGVCPSTHPVRFVSLFYELWFYPKKFNDLHDGGRFLMSTGDPTGYSLHGDFMNGWDNTVLQRAVDNCTALSGVIEDCPVFENEGRFYTDAEMDACSAPNPYPEDEVSLGEVLPYLPGCVAVTEGPAPARPGDVVPGCKAAGVGGSGNGSAASSGVPTPMASPTSHSLGPGPVRLGNASHSSSSMSAPSTANPSLILSTMSPAANGPQVRTETPVSSSSGVPTPMASPASQSSGPGPVLLGNASHSSSSMSAPSTASPSLTSTMSPAANGPQVRTETPVSSASPTSSHDCGEHSAHPTSSMAAAHRRHHKRGNESPRYF